LRDLVNPNLSVGGRAELCCELAKDFEDRGDYEAARELLSGLWPSLGERPKVEGLERSIAAEVLLRVGVLTGIIGSNNQIADAQETAKNLIGESLTIFESKRNKTRSAEARIELALCYWRTGEYKEAADLLKDALAQLIIDSDLKAKTVIRIAIVDTDVGHLSEALRFLTDNAPLFEKINNQTLKGSYHQTLGDVLVLSWESEGPTAYLDRALVEYAAASYHFEQAEHRRYRANVENNLGFIHFQVNRCPEAHKHLDRARSILTSLKDKAAVAQVDETRARVFLKEGRNAEAEKVARSSVRALEKGNMQFALAESLMTHGTALARLEDYGLALSVFRRAIDVAQKTGALNRAAQAALTLVQEMGERLVAVERRTLIGGRNFSQEIHAHEHDLITYALETAKGSVTRAAYTLGISYQELNYMLKTRHKDLTCLRTPVHRRPRRSQ